jgi:hypothetical protein
VYSIFWQAASVASASLRVAVGRGVFVGVGCGMRRSCPTIRVSQAAGILFSRTILWIETPKANAIEEHVSPDATLYASGVEVGMGMSVGVGGTGVVVIVTVAVTVWVGVTVGSTT